jgi:hypothetical protein
MTPSLGDEVEEEEERAALASLINMYARVLMTTGLLCY